MTVVRGNKGIGRAVGGVAAPVPLNTPSVRRENNGRDPSVNIVPGRTNGIWGQSSEDNSPDPRGSASASAASAPAPAPVVSKPAPWAKPTSSQSAPDPQAEEAPGASKTAPPAPRALATNWADVDVDSDEDDSPPVSRGSAGVSQPTAQLVRSAEPSPHAANLGNSPFIHGLPAPTTDGGYRKERSGSGSFQDSLADQRRFGSFGSGGGYGQQHTDDARFGPNRGAPFGSGDARLGGPPHNDPSVRAHTHTRCSVLCF
jgi:hypothetical protein